MKLFADTADKIITNWTVKQPPSSIIDPHVGLFYSASQTIKHFKNTTVTEL